jgi:hypothetical protein
MYGNNFDYTGQQPDVDREILQEIMDDTRNNTNKYTAQGFPDSDMGDRFEEAGVGDVSAFLDEAYAPFIPEQTPSYADFMSKTPQNIANTIGAVQAQYQTGRAARTQDFQNILNDVKKYTYGDDDAFANAGSPAIPNTVDLDNLNGNNAAAAEIDALRIKRIQAVDGEPLEYFADTFGKSFGLNDYDRLLAGGQSEDVIQGRINQYAKEGGTFGAGVKQMDFFEPRPTIGSFMKGSGFGKEDKARAQGAGYSNAEIREWKKKTGN